jgi:hypothetical protein
VSPWSGAYVSSVSGASDWDFGALVSLEHPPRTAAKSANESAATSLRPDGIVMGMADLVLGVVA